jgi:hypothetical protein
VKKQSFIKPVGSTIALVLMVTLGACGLEPDVGQLAQDQQILKTCPKDTKLATKIDLDVSGSGGSPDLEAQRTAVIRQLARQTAICRGHLLVTVFSATSAATVALYGGELTLQGATNVPAASRAQLASEARASAAGGPGRQLLMQGNHSVDAPIPAVRFQGRDCDT